MKPLSFNNMRAALQLTRDGDLVAATALLQKTLRGGSVPERRAPVLTLALPPAASERSDVDPAGQFFSLSFENAAGTRAYKLYVPRDYHGQPCPLIVMLHGCAQSPDDFAAGTRMNELADEFSCFIAYPEQSTTANASKCWNWFKRGDQGRDGGEPSIIAGITREVMQHYAIDREGVYVAGMSAGGAAAAVLASAYPEVYQGLAVHSGLTCGLAHDVGSAFAAMKDGEGDSRAREADRPFTQRPIRTIVFHGDRDATVHPRNGDRFSAAMAMTDCKQRVRTGHVDGGRAYTQTAYTNASGQTVFEQWVIHGAGHAWSGGSPSGSYTDPKGPDASREIMRFFLCM